MSLNVSDHSYSFLADSAIPHLADFFCLYEEGILEKPFGGLISSIRALFADFCRSKNVVVSAMSSPADFHQALLDFNDVSANALDIVNTGFGEEKRVDWIKMDNIRYLKMRLENPSSLEIAPASVERALPAPSSDLFQALVGILKEPLRTKPKEETSGIMGVGLKKGYDYDYARLWKNICEPTAMVILGIERARLLTPKRPFFEVCDNKRHIDMMTTTFFNSKILGQSNDIPSSSRVSKLFMASQNLIDKDTLQCIRTKTHFLPLITNCTDVHLGNCSYLDTCHKLKNCRYVHYFTMYPTQPNTKQLEKPLLALDYTIGECHDCVNKKVLPAQWINCDVRHLPFSILGKFAAIISDPAWDIHMALPYGTCKDTELLSLPMQELQDEGIICLWVTGRSIEIGRKALVLWGYTVSDEVIWIKTNQLNRTIVTGRTGHWLNHSKEHLLIGIKGNPIWINRKIDLDFIVSGTRETLRKPDELYEIVERIVGKHARKLEIFGRDNNIRPGWVSMYTITRHMSLTINYILTSSDWKSGNRNLNIRGRNATKVYGAPSKQGRLKKAPLASVYMT